MTTSGGAATTPSAGGTATTGGTLAAAGGAETAGGAATTGGATTAEGGAPASEAGAGGAATTAEYWACYTIGAYDRIFLTKFDEASGTCVVAEFLAPLAGTSGLELPENWGLERADLSLGQRQDCRARPSGPVRVSFEARGRVSWDTASGVPADLEAALEIRFAAEEPISQRFDVSGLLIKYCGTE